MEDASLLSEIGQNVYDRRNALRLTQRQLASMAGVSERLVRSIETGQASGIGLGKLEAVLAPLGLSLTLSGVDRHGSRSDTTSNSQADEYEALLQKAIRSWNRAGDERG